MTVPVLDTTVAPYAVRETCRVCGEPLGVPYLDLGNQPLANALVSPDTSDEEQAFPLQVALCRTCGLSQLTVVVDPAVLYTHYRFASGTSGAWRYHCDQLAAKASPGYFDPTHEFPDGKFVVDIAANDGTQLAFFKKYGWRVLGVEPSDVPVFRWGTYGHEREVDVPMLRRFFDIQTAHKIRTEHGPADLVVAQNVLGHVDDPTAFLRGVAHMLSETGRAVIEVPHVRDLIQSCAFDTIYHEHLSYWSTAALVRCARHAGLILESVDALPDIHGGSRRYWLRRDDKDGVAAGKGVYSIPVDPHPYRVFANDVERRIQQVKRTLGELAGQDVVMGAFGASAKGAVMLNALKSRGNTVWPCAIIDETPEKQGLLSPGTRIPIVSLEESGVIEWDVCWVLSWNWLAPIKDKLREHGFRGSFLVTAPHVTVSD